jgi:hypothetical protein
MAKFASATASDLSSTLPLFTESDAIEPPDLPASAKQFYSFLKKVERVMALAAWWISNRQSFVEKWSALRGVADGEGNFPSESLEGKLTSLETALEKAAPLDDLAKALKEAASEAEKRQTIRAEQLVREAIADAIEPLKDLRVLVAAETAITISALSGRMKSVLDRIHFKERLSFEDAALSKKTVQVTGSFDHGIRVDVAAFGHLCLRSGSRLWKRLEQTRFR